MPKEGPTQACRAPKKSPPPPKKKRDIVASRAPSQSLLHYAGCSRGAFVFLGEKKPKTNGPVKDESGCSAGSSIGPSSGFGTSSEEHSIHFRRHCACTIKHAEEGFVSQSTPTPPPLPLEKSISIRQPMFIALSLSPDYCSR